MMSLLQWLLKSKRSWRRTQYLPQLRKQYLYIFHMFYIVEGSRSLPTLYQTLIFLLFSNRWALISHYSNKFLPMLFLKEIVTVKHKHNMQQKNLPNKVGKCTLWSRHASQVQRHWVSNNYNFHRPKQCWQNTYGFGELR